MSNEYNHYTTYMAKHSSSLLGRTMHHITASIDRGVKYYETTITIKPSSNIRGFGKIYYGDPNLQIRALTFALRTQATKRNISLLGIFEYHANGNIHIHACIKHSTGYQKHIRLFQNWCKRHIGNTRTTEIRNIYNYFSYILKEYEPGQELIIGHETIVHKIEDYTVPITQLKENYKTKQDLFDSLESEYQIESLGCKQGARAMAQHPAPITHQ